MRLLAFRKRLENRYEKRAPTYKSETPFGLYTIKFYIQSKFAAVMPHFAGISMLPFHRQTHVSATDLPQKLPDDVSFHL